MSNDKQDPLVSVAVITYNQKDFLRECIESILIQDYQNLEIVVADDCSNDGTQELLLEYKNKYPDKFVIKLAPENQGITKNSNEAHFACTGKYIAWIGGDDLMLPQKISTQVKAMENNDNAVLCYHDLDVFQSETGNTIYKFNHMNKPRIGGLNKIVKYGAFNGASSTMVRRSATPLKGFDIRIPIASDWLYWVQTLYSGGEIIFIDKVMGKYRRHNNNVTNAVNTFPLKNVQDHLASTIFILTEKPELAREVRIRQSELMRGMKNYNLRGNYKDYLMASLYIKFNFKAVIELILYYLGRYK